MGVEGDEIDLGSKALQQLGEPDGVLFLVIDAADEDVFESDHSRVSKRKLLTG